MPGLSKKSMPLDLLWNKIAIRTFCLAILVVHLQLLKKHFYAGEPLKVLVIKLLIFRKSMRNKESIMIEVRNP